MMADRFTLGIEEEFQLVKRGSGELCSCAQSILDKGAPYFEEKIKPEMLQSTVEYNSDVLPDLTAARKELYAARALLARLVNEEGLALVSAGTHPSAAWRDQERTEHERYIELEEEYQDIGRSILIFGLHVHVAVQDKELQIKIMNQVRTWLPHLMAFSSNSPFWHIRPHAFFDTLEFRICDMPSMLEDTLGIAALCQALVAKLAYLNQRDKCMPTMRRDYIEENKWRAMRYGLDAQVLDFDHMRRLSMRDSIRETLDFVDDMVDDLGSRREINYLRELMDDPQGTGADRQIAIYQESSDLQKVQQFLIERTMEGVKLDDADLSRKPLRFRSRKLAKQAK